MQLADDPLPAGQSQLAAGFDQSTLRGYKYDPFTFLGDIKLSKIIFA